MSQVLQIQTLRFPVTPMAGWERFQHPIPVLKSQESNQTPDSKEFKAEVLLFLQGVYRIHTGQSFTRIFKRRNMARAALLEVEAILIKDSLLPLPAEVVSSLAHMPVKAEVWTEFSAHKTGSEEAKSAKSAGGSRNHHWAVFPGKAGGKSLNLQIPTWFWDLQQHRNWTWGELSGNVQILKGWWGGARTWRAAQKQRMLSPNSCSCPASCFTVLWGVNQIRDCARREVLSCSLKNTLIE